MSLIEFGEKKLGDGARERERERERERGGGGGDGEGEGGECECVTVTKSGCRIASLTSGSRKHNGKNIAQGERGLSHQLITAILTEDTEK